MSVCNFCLISIRSLLSNSVTKTKLLNNEMVLQNKLSLKIWNWFAEYSFRDVVLKIGNFRKKVWAHYCSCLQLFWGFLSSDFFFEPTHIKPKVRLLILFDKYSQVLKSVVVYLCSLSDLSCMLMKQNVNSDVSRNSPIQPVTKQTILQ